MPEFTVYSALKMPSCGLVVFIDMKIYMVTEVIWACAAPFEEQLLS